MAEHGPGTVAVLCSTWGADHDETAFVLRGVAAALSRLATVQVLAPGPVTRARADGAFEVTCVGGGATAERWPSTDATTWPTTGPMALAVVDGDDAGAASLLGTFASDLPVVRIVSGGPAAGHDRWLSVGAGRPEGSTDGCIGLHVPAARLAAARRHVGIGFTDYVLVLGDRGPNAAAADTPTPLASWLAARFASRHVVVVENGVASVWRARSLRGSITVDTRTDLWRLLAHARVTVDLSPGPLIARECVESLLYGVPVVAPAGTAGARLAALGGGLWFDDPAGLLGCVGALDDRVVRDTLGEQGRAVASAWYGDPAGFVRRVADALNGWGIDGVSGVAR
jgi:hypothetical protein